MTSQELNKEFRKLMKAYTAMQAMTEGSYSTRLFNRLKKYGVRIYQ